MTCSEIYRRQKRRTSLGVPSTDWCGSSNTLAEGPSATVGAAGHKRSLVGLTGQSEEFSEAVQAMRLLTAR
jgi:hypothetical protein